GLDIDFDLVVSGVNHGPNAGNYVVGRSGTVGAGIEAAFLGTPAIAVSAYHAADFFPHPPDSYDFGRPARVTRKIAKEVLARPVFEQVDFLNVNAPLDTPNPSVQLTRPLHDYDQHVNHGTEDGDESNVELGEDEELVRLRDITWPDTIGFKNPFPISEEHEGRYPAGTDRRALIEGDVSVSPLTVSHGHVSSEPLADAIRDIDEAGAETEIQTD
ncbi:MAG: 5'/3'-nucleotidase SurE, partial [Halobacteriaceae archaeon]